MVKAVCFRLSSQPSREAMQLLMVESLVMAPNPAVQLDRSATPVSARRYPAPLTPVVTFPSLEQSSKDREEQNRQPPRSVIPAKDPTAR